jgi:hypothetical protein
MGEENVDEKPELRSETGLASASDGMDFKASAVDMQSEALMAGVAQASVSALAKRECRIILSLLGFRRARSAALTGAKI